MIYRIIVSFLEAMISAIFIINLLPRKYHHLLQLGIWCTVSVSILLVTQSVFWLGRVLMIVTETLLCCLMYEERRIKCVLFYLLKEGTRLLSVGLTIWLYRYVSSEGVGFFGAFGEENIACFLLYLIVYSVLAAMVLHFRRDEMGVHVPWIVGTQAVLLAGETAAITAVVKASETGIDMKHTPFAVLAAFFMVIANISIGILIPYLLKKISMANNMVLGRELSNMEYKYYEKSVENEKKMQMIRHEIANQIQTAYAMFQSGENQRGLEFINDLKLQYEMVDPIVYCSNPLLNIILTNKKSEAENKEIEFQTRIKQDLENIGIPDFDLSTVICNLLDNAIRGCECSGQSNPKLTIEILEKNQYLVIRVLNSCKVSMNIENTERIKTTKNNSQAHGLGMPIIAGITRKYRGDFIVSAKNGLFTATVVMSLK